MREQQGLRFDIFRSYTTANDTAGAIKALRKYGPQEPQLYPAALAYFTSSTRVLEEAGDEFDAVLKKIDEDGLMAPLQVIQTLSTNTVATMGMVKKYLSDTIERERREISNVTTAPLHSCSHNYHLPSLHRIVASSKATGPKHPPSAKRLTSSALSPPSSKPVAAPPVAVLSISPLFIFSASTPSTSAASTRSTTMRSVHCAASKTLRSAR